MSGRFHDKVVLITGAARGLGRRAAERFRSGLKTSGIPKIFDCVLTVRAPSAEPRLDGSGMIVVNPPFTLADEARTLLGALARVLGEDGQGDFSVEWLVGET